MEDKEREIIIDEIINKKTKERIFPILNKFDRIWEYHVDKSFCEIYLLITNNNNVTDLEFTKLMDKYIENTKIN
jgi:hypothetical protein